MEGLAGYVFDVYFYIAVSLVGKNEEKKLRALHLSCHSVPYFDYCE